MSANGLPQIIEWLQAQHLKGPKMKDAPVFLRNLEEALDKRRSEHNLVTLRTRTDEHDFSSNDFLSLTGSGQLREAFFQELAEHPDFRLGSTGSRLLDGNNPYIELVEREAAEHHGAERATIVNSGFEGNCAIFSSIPRPGDAIVYDELVHASVHEGMARSTAMVRRSFRHNDVEHFREVLEAVKESQPLIARGQRCVIVSLESIYSMDGDVCPLKEIVDVVKELFPAGNYCVVVDEAHATGVVGKHGVGLVAHLRLQKDVAIRLHTYSKAMACSGGVILSDETIRTYLFQHARPLYFTASPSFPTLASIRAGYKLMRSGKTEAAQERLQDRIKLFFRTMTTHPMWEEFNEAGIIQIPLADGWEERPFQTQIIPVLTETRANYFLSLHLQLLTYWAFPIDPPVVPKGTSRVRLVFKASNTEDEVLTLAGAICEWAKEMLELKKSGQEGGLPTAARQVFTMMASGGVGSGAGGGVEKGSNGVGAGISVGVASVH